MRDGELAIERKMWERARVELNRDVWLTRSGSYNAGWILEQLVGEVRDMGYAARN